MQITVYERVAKEVNLSDSDVTNITINALERMVYPGEYLREQQGKVVLMQDDPHHRHGSISEVYVRDATKQDIAVFEMLKYLKG